MKFRPPFALFLGSLLLAGCESISEPRIGMSEKQWLRDAVLSDQIYAEGAVTAYKSNRQYYYFRNGVLAKIAPEWISAQKIEEMNRPAQMGGQFDTYGELKKLDELRKDKIITEEEFQAQKKKILER